MHRKKGKMSLYDRAVALYNQKNYTAAAKILERLSAKKKNQPDVWNFLGVVYRRVGKLQKAVVCIEKATRLSPDNPFFQNNLGNALKDNGRYQEALERFKMAVKIKPDYVEAYANMAIALTKLENYEQSAGYAQKAIDLNPGYAPAYLEMGCALLNMNRTDSAKAHFFKAVEIQPVYPNVYSNLGTCYVREGEPAMAKKYFTIALEQKSGYASVLYQLANIEKAVPGDPRFKTISSAAKQTHKPEDLRHCYFALGKMYADIKDYDKSFQYYRKANEMRLKLTKTAFHPGEHKDSIRRMIACYDDQFFKKRNGLGSQSQVPVFILGMPRSGTTLVEQILSSHSSVIGGGELNHLDAIAGEITKEKKLATKLMVASAMDGAMAEAAAGSYLRRLEKDIGQLPARVTDKMPFNFMYLPMIALMFPNAKIIHCARNPMDTCLSAFFQNFSEELLFTSNLDHLAIYYQEYQKLMAHWKKVLPMPVLDVSYEDVVDDQAFWTKKILAFCKLEWEDACLKFYRQERSVATASAWQVRQKIYTSSKKKWQKYEKHLGPLAALMQN